MASYISYSGITTFQNQTYFVNWKPSGIYTHILKRMLEQLEIMLQHHSKVHMIRFDLHIPDYSDNNKIISDFIGKYKSELIKEYQFKRIGYAWAREIEKKKNQHYHFVIFLDGHKIKGGIRAVKIADKIWRSLGGTESTPNKSGYYKNISRNNFEDIADVIWWISYLAKGRGKGYRPPQTKDYSTSRL